MSPSPRPLFVDLDGTLLKSDLLLESALAVLKTNPLALLRMPFWLLRGKAALKAELAQRTDLRADLLPYDPRVLEWLRSEADRGRSITLISASHESLVQRVAAHVGLFDAAVGSTTTHNLKGRNKLAEIQARCADTPFDYAGNTPVDLDIWQGAAGAVVVNASPDVQRRAAAVTDAVASFPSEGRPWLALLKAMRLHQWLKNALVFLPLILSHQVTDVGLLLTSLGAFLAFGLCASSVYLLNDMLDLPADRQHETKRFRPFAAGDLSLLTGLMVTPVLLLAGFALATWVSLPFLAMLSIYYVVTVLYSFLLKSIMLVDVLTLAGLYTIRIIAGAAAIGVVPTFWLLGFSMFLFLSLAMIKRVAELVRLVSANREQAAGRGYETGDLQILTMLGSSSGMMSVLVFALYVNAEKTRVLYHTPEILWLICPLLLYMIGRIWIIAHRGRLHHDPVVFVARDTCSQVVVLLCGLLIWLAS